jgi:phage antirepressor YoqD-like protein
MADEAVKKAMAQHRADRFKVQISETSNSNQTGEFALQITHNGSQWQNMYLNAAEAEKVIQILQEHLAKLKSR